MKSERERYPLHIVHTEASQGWGGQEIRILTEAQGMLERGHRVTLLAPPGARIFQVAGDMGVTAVPAPLEKKRLRGALALRRWLRVNCPDIINTHSSTDTWLAAIARLFGGPRIPLVRTRHISAPVKNSRNNRWLYGRASQQVVTTGERLRQQLISDLGLPENHVVSVPTGIDLQRFSAENTSERNAIRAECGISADTVVIGIAATLRSWKGHDFLLEAFVRLADEATPVALLIAGDGPRREVIQDWIANAAPDVAKHIHMLGHRDDVPEVLAAMDIFTLPSYANEGVPQAIMQAMAMGLPVVSTTAGAIDEAVDDGVTGLLVPPKNVDALHTKLAALVQDADLRQRLGTAGRARAERLFSRDAMLDAMEDVFYGLLEDVASPAQQR